MTFTIHYRKRNEEHQIDWVVPPGWSDQAIRDAFAFQYGTSAEILSITPKQP